MNRRNNWKELLEFANKDLAKDGKKLEVTEDEGYYGIVLVVLATGERTCYADNYFDDELSDLVNDAWAWASRN